jgi:hypothetical protein
MGDETYVNESIGEIHRLLQEVVGHLQPGSKAQSRKAIAKLKRIEALASTLALTIETQR